jgi:plastocyanin
MRIFVPLALSLVIAASPVAAKDITVKMLTQGKSGMMVFEPAFVKANVGDTVHFVPTTPSHNAELIKDIAPAGVVPASARRPRPPHQLAPDRPRPPLTLEARRGAVA